MTALTKNSFQFPKLGSMLDALNQTIQKRTNSKSTTFGKRAQKGAALAPCHWNSLSDVRRHRHSKYVHHIRVTQEGSNARMEMMYFKPPKNDNKAHHIDLQSAFMHVLLIERSDQGTIEKVSFGMQQGQQDTSQIAMTQTLEGNIARQFIATLSRGWIRDLLPKEDMDIILANTGHTIKRESLATLMESTQIMVERAATMHERMLGKWDNPAARRTLDQAVLHVYQKGDTELQAAAIFHVDADDISSRKELFDQASSALGTPASKLVVEHLMKSEKDERMGNRCTPHTGLVMGA